MRSLRLPPVAVALLLLGIAAPVASAQRDPDAPPRLSPVLARNLIAQALEVNEAEIDVAYVLNGEKAMTKGFSSSAAAAAVYLATKFEDGHRRRRCQEQIFLYSEEFGWFLEEVVEEQFRDYLRIWSEKRGYLELK